MGALTEVELNQIRAKLRRLELSDEVIERYLRKCEANIESFASASRSVEQWEKADPEDFILQTLVCGLTAAVLGGWLALMSGV